MQLHSIALPICRTLRLLSIGLLCLSSSALMADTFPSRAITFILPYSPGGSSDAVARALGQEIAKATGHGLVVESRPGGNTVIGTQAMLDRPADGYAVSLAAASSVIVPQLLSRLPYDFHADVAPVTLLYSNPHVLVISSKNAPDDLRSCHTWIAGKQGKATYSSVGTGSSIHLGFERFKQHTGLELLQIPYKGSPAAVMAVLSGEVDATFADVGVVLPHLQAGTLRAIAVGGEKRSPALPDTPTFAEAGLPGFISQTWMGLITNAKVPADRIQQLNQMFTHALGQPGVQNILAQQGVEAAPNTPEAFGKFMKAEGERFAEIIRKEKISLQ